MSIASTFRALFTMGKGVVVGLSEETAGQDPITLFTIWYQEATAAGLYLPESAALATATADGRPNARSVLIKSFDERGFVFYTNYESRKADEIAENPRAALSIHWPVLQRQVRIEGTVEKTSEGESSAYFATRSRGSCIGAWASKQSAVLGGRKELVERFDEYRRKFEGDEVPLPPFWGGYRVVPEAIEFWQGRLNRLHDRLLFTRDGDTWRRVRLAP
jgi:pyridoxamine 5'-phosphate oxidase